MGEGETSSPSDDGSEHTIDGKNFDLEMHIVNLNQDESTKEMFRAAVIGILFNVDENAEPSFADNFFQSLMKDEKLMNFQTDFVDHLDFSQRYVYHGSLTTPPFSEGLFWTVLAEPISITPKTAELFKE